MTGTKIIKGGTIVTASDTYKGDIVIEGEKIRAIGSKLKPYKGTEVIDARGKLVFPGGIDVHVHLQLPFCGTVSSDDFENGTKAAACGGLTTLIDFAIQSKGKRIMEAVEARRAEADGKVCIDYSLHGGITDWNDRTRREIKKAIDYGIPSFKMFMIYKDEGWMADDGILFNGLEETARFGGMIMVHAESVFILELLINRYHTPEMMKKYRAYAHALSRPYYVEEEAIIRAIKWAEVTNGNLYIVHMSTGGGADAVKAGREKGVNVWSETGPQYLLLEDSVFKKKNGHCYATCPQIKKKGDCARLWKGLRAGEVSIIATDTCTFTTKQKAMWKGDFTKIPFGLPGVETMVPLMYTYGVGKKRISLNRFVQLVSTNPAKLHGLYPEKGTIAVGSDADIVVFDPKKKVTLSHKKLQTNCDWSPFEGFRLQGYPHMTFSRGKLVAREGKFVGDVGHGRFVRRKPGGWKLLI
ncbi:MAG: dihydropyrimidinase [Candidatus Tritonobacter lacicola]|nr:dihydropyrimidinase [Candidatus Tritonobacter lacicola]